LQNTVKWCCLGLVWWRCFPIYDYGKWLSATPALSYGFLQTW
jgi:hypothetical protein